MPVELPATAVGAMAVQYRSANRGVHHGTAGAGQSSQGTAPRSQSTPRSCGSRLSARSRRRPPNENWFAEIPAALIVVLTSVSRVVMMEESLGFPMVTGPTNWSRPVLTELEGSRGNTIRRLCRRSDVRGDD